MAMLSVVRKALAKTIDDAMNGQARVIAYTPRKIDIPTTGVHIFIAPDQSDYLRPWMSFDPQQWCHLRYSVTISVPDDNPERAADLLDSLIDPTISGQNVFAAIYNTPGLGLTAFHVDAQPMLTPIAAAARMADATSNVTFWELTFPVEVVVQTPTS